MDNKIEQLRKMIKESKNIVVFTGAGISVASGIPDFRSANGIYNEKLNSTYRPEEIISHSFFMEHPDIFYDFYFTKMVYPDAKPNKAHLFFKKLAETKNVTIVTQNIDSLDKIAGSKKVYEIHGTVLDYHCMRCNKQYKLSDLNMKEVPMCSCGGLIKPNVVLYEEGLDEYLINASLRAIEAADMLIIVGTSLVVYPAASFVRYYFGHKMVLINKSITPMDNYADLVINDDIIHVVEELENGEN